MTTTTKGTNKLVFLTIVLSVISYALAGLFILLFAAAIGYVIKEDTDAIRGRSREEREEYERTSA